MNNTTFTYSLLRYVHSQSGGESLNVGILFIFPAQRQVIFHHPSRLARLLNTYKSFPEWLVKAHLRGIKQKAQQVSTDWTLFSGDLLKDPWAFICKEFLLEDATALQFSELRAGVSDTADLAELAQSYYNLFFRDYEEQDLKQNQRNEKYIAQKFHKNLLAKDKEIERYLKKDVEVKSPELTLKFDYGWQNHQLHLVKPLAFDLETDEGIQEKSARNFGYLTLLSQTAEEKNYTFDILVTRPSDKNLYSAYDKALKVLEAVKTSKKIIEEPQFEEYSSELLDQIIK
jgi:hypothetical protein